MLETECYNLAEVLTSAISLGPIGVFDSGYGGLTILRDLRRHLPQYDYLYLGDNARAPYGTRSFEVVYRYTLEAVGELFSRGCPLVILACNTASAKALRTIQQRDLPEMDPTRRVLGVIRPTVESLGGTSKSRHIGVLATPGTVASHSYMIETLKLYPEMIVTEQECPLWAAIVESSEADSDGADYFVKKRIDALMDRDPYIDTLVLGCTHYPLLIDKIRKYAPEHAEILEQGHLVAESLADYLRRHPEMECRLRKTGSAEYLTSENPEKFDALASLFTNDDVHSRHCPLD
ncbi:MAG: glutamate racemase [Muribaculum sp.]|nr:glutamate racemase [Muribaculum sp.]